MKRALLLLCLTAGCASSSARSGIEARDFVHAALGSIAIRRVSTILVVAPPTTTESKLELSAFSPPQLDQPLSARIGGESSVGDAEPVRRLLSNRLSELGLEPCGSSTTASAAASIAPATLRNALAEASGCDALLVVRVVPVDRFAIDEGAGVVVRQTALGKERIRDFRSVPRTGRLMVGQAFLFDVASGARVWSRQAPEFPEDARLTLGHPFLAYGHVDPVGATPLSGETLATAASSAFVANMFASFPRRTDGSAEGRAALDHAATTTDADREDWLDESHVLVSASGTLSFEPFDSGLTWFEQPLDTIGTGAIAPSGRFTIAPVLGYQAAGGRIYALGFSWSQTRADFGRTYHLDAPSGDRTVSVKSRGADGVGLDLRLGQLFGPGPLRALLPDVFIVPTVGVFGESWTLEVTPSSVAEDIRRFRVGALGTLDVWLRPGAAVFVRVGLEGRLGLDTERGVYLGGGGSLGAGVFL
ncbi:MAG: hypothetical protein HY791_27830 [Deltaproteobacteria bacterium]|nr:hypothetical protein [Deltaproteobacteria bacterium]